MEQQTNSQNDVTNEEITSSELEQAATSNPRPASFKRTDFYFFEELGEGSFSTVYLVSERATKRHFAIKMCIKSQLIRERKVAQVFREKEILSILSKPENCSPFVIRLYCTFQDNDHLYFVLSLAEQKDLLVRMRKLGGCLTIDQSRFVLSELYSSLAHIHSLGIIHRDVKPENILVRRNGHILLSDFGCSKQINTETGQNLIPSTTTAESRTREQSTSSRTIRPRRCSFVGTSFYVSPEVLNGDPTSPACDLWATGVVAFQLLCGSRPFDDESEYLLYRHILRLRYTFPKRFPSGNVGNDARDLIQRMLVINPRERLGSSENGGFKAIQKHQFFNGVDWDNLPNTPPPTEFIAAESPRRKCL